MPSELGQDFDRIIASWMKIKADRIPLPAAEEDRRTLTDELLAFDNQMRVFRDQLERAENLAAIHKINSG